MIGTFGRVIIGLLASKLYGRFNPNTHRRRRRDSTVELRRVGFGDNSQLAHELRLLTDLVDNLETD